MGSKKKKKACRYADEKVGEKEKLMMQEEDRRIARQRP